MALTPITIDALPGKKGGNAAVSARMTEYEEMLRECNKGQAYALPVETGDTPRGMALRISRAATRLNLIATVVSGTNNGKPVVGFEIARDMTNAEIKARADEKAAREQQKAIG